MVHAVQNPWRGTGLDRAGIMPVADARAVGLLLALCPVHQPTPLLDLPALANHLDVARVSIKDERARMGLGSFKALGAAYAIACDAVATGAPDLHAALGGRVYVTASAGNHGLSVAAGARVFGAQAVIYLASSVPDSFALRLRAMGADVVRAGDDYAASMLAASDAADAQGWTLLSDTAWSGYTDAPLRVMEGYLQVAAEIVAQIDTIPTHVVLQAGVGGFAAACAAHMRAVWGDAVQIIVVEPAAAPALMDSICAGHIVDTTGPVSCMGRLDCKTPSLVALNGLARDACVFATLSEPAALHGAAVMAAFGLPTTPSGAAGIAAVLGGLDVPPDAHVLAVLTEAA